ncbi:dipeptidase [Microbulbifer sp. THAF38]|uniref:dipeptidase n=1 Tax=Microbulbifer sp. THAF38 TaxID=2587856 RepID=UPI0012695214|nr:dipeptidase [Microbulbifer sp. THAF38]QFT53013.1 Membrane dipeptidase (Peptidase family M19) [Microbulbifer sp. THAF38]
MKKNIFIIILLFVACDKSIHDDRRALAKKLTQENILVDGHIDVPYRISQENLDVGISTEGGDFDFPRAKSGGLNAPFMSIYIPAEKETNGTAKDYADQLISSVEDLVATYPNKFAIPKSIDELRKQVEQGKISLPLGMENGAAIEGRLENLEYFYNRGVRYITLTHSKSNHISDSSYDDSRPWKGLSEFGKKLVGEMNALGIMIDVSHVSDEAFWQVIEISSAPVIASHSSARHFTPGFERNMSDAMIIALAEQGGLIMVNFGSTFISAKSRSSQASIAALVESYMRESNLSKKSPIIEEYTRSLYKDKFVYANLDDVLDHFDHIRNLVGVDHIGIGSDFDGVGDSLPIGLKDVSEYPNIVFGLLERGYSEEDIKKILGGNLLRVWQGNETYAAFHGR